MLLITIIAACFTLIGVAGITPFFAALADPAILQSNTLLIWLDRVLEPQSTQAFIVWLGAGFLVLLCLSNLANFVAIVAISRFSQNVGAQLHILLFDEYLHRDIGFHGQHNSAELESHIVGDVMRTVGGVVQSGLMLVAGTVSIALITVAVVIIDPVIALGSAVLLGMAYAAVYTLVRRRLIRNGIVTSHYWRKRAKTIADSLNAIKDVTVSRAQREMVDQVARSSIEIARAVASTSAIAVSPKFALEFVMAAGLIASALWINSRVGPGQWLTHLAFLGFAAYRLLPAIQQAFTAAARIRSDRASFEMIAQDLSSARHRVSQSSRDRRDDEWRGRPHRGIRLKNVSYRHSSERFGGIEAISLSIPAGAIVGLVGPNGSGKTTLADIILGLLKPNAGTIEVDDVPLDDGNRDAWLSTVAYVPQQVALLDASVAQNIAFRLAPDSIDLARVKEAASRARLDELLDSMPAGLASLVGQDGVQLSGGQRQRIGIARAFYRGASLLILDEATSALDDATEHEIITLLKALRGSCTVILIAHRLSALKSCDALFNLKAGRLVAETTFHEYANVTSRSDGPLGDRQLL